MIDLKLFYVFHGIFQTNTYETHNKFSNQSKCMNNIYMKLITIINCYSQTWSLHLDDRSEDEQVGLNPDSRPELA